MSVTSAIETPRDVESGPWGSRSDFRELYDEHVGLVFRTLRRFGVPDSSLDDATQDVFAVVHRRRATFEGRSSLKSWIFGIARRVARNHRGTSTAPVLLSNLEAFADDVSDEVPGEQLEKARLLQRLLGSLSDDRREIFLLVELEGFTLAEAADALAENQHTLGSRLRAARKDLQQMLVRLEARDEWKAGCVG